MAFRHLSVMARQVLELLQPIPGGRYLDGTLGGGGHSGLILKASGPDGFLVGIDRDREALAAAQTALSQFDGRFSLCHGPFWDVAKELAAAGERFNGFLLDLGVSSHQLDTAERGFSFRLDGPLDMRMDRDEPLDAAGLVNDAPEAELARILKVYGEERRARRIASVIVRERAKSMITTTGMLAEIVMSAVPRREWEERIHPATRTFQALRIAVNGEIDELEGGIRSLFELLIPGGRGVVISFHSLEDRIVKNCFRDFATGCVCPRNFPQCVCKRTPVGKVLTGRPLIADEDELAENPRARSAKLRAVEKL